MCILSRGELLLFAERGCKLLHGDGQLGFDGFDGEVEEVGYVFVFEAVFFDEGEDEFATGRELVDGGAEALKGFRAEEEGFGVCVEPDVGIASFAEFDGGEIGVVAEIVERAVLYGDIQIYFRVGDIRVVFCFLPEFEEDVVDDLFGGFFLMDDGIAKA